METEAGDTFPLRYSLFPHVPPYIRILPHGQVYNPSLPKELAQFTWNAPSGISPVIENTVTQAGFTLIQGQIRRKEDQQTGAIWDCLPVTEKSKDEINFGGLNEEVKINQFPGLFILGRKDNLWLCYEIMKNKFGPEHFNFLPTTYILPKDKDLLISEMKKKKKAWIVKPPNWFCGIGISLIDNIKEIPDKKSSMCVQEYIDRPFLIKGLKFDLRLYVLLTSIDPVRIYIYEDGLVRFATKTYSNSPDEIKNNFIHLTNFSVNKNNEEFVYNENPGDYEGHKWNLKTLWKYFDEEIKIPWKPIWEDIKDICTKTVLCGHEHMSKAFNKTIKSDYNCYKLFGFDVFIDADLKPWIIEVNNIPSLHTNTIDSFVNYPMAAEMLNIVGFHIPKVLGNKSYKAVAEKLGLKLPSSCFGFNPKLYTRLKTESENEKRNQFISEDLSREEYCENILQDISPSDLRILINSEDELSQTFQWTRTFPSKKNSDFLKYLYTPCYSDRLLDAWETKYGGSKQARTEGILLIRELCANKEHLETPQVGLRSSRTSRYDFTPTKEHN